MSFDEGGVISLPVDAFALEERLKHVSPPLSPSILDRLTDGQMKAWEFTGQTQEEWEAEQREQEKESNGLLFEKLAAEPMIVWRPISAEIAGTSGDNNTDSDEGSGGCPSTPREGERILESNGDSYGGDDPFANIPEHLLWKSESAEETARREEVRRRRQQRQRPRVDPLDLGRDQSGTHLSCPACGMGLTMRTETKLEMVSPSPDRLPTQHGEWSPLDSLGLPRPRARSSSVPRRWGNRNWDIWKRHVPPHAMAPCVPPSWVVSAGRRTPRSEDKHWHSSTSLGLGPGTGDPPGLWLPPASWLTSKNRASIDQWKSAEAAKGELGARGSSETSVRGQAWLCRAGQALAGLRALPSAAGVVFVVGVAASFYAGKRFA